MGNVNGNAALAVLPEAPTAGLVGVRGVEINDIATLMWMAEHVIKSGLAPKDCQTVSAAVIRAQMGMELGLSFMYSIQNIASINGRPSLWGNAIPALVKASPACEVFTGHYIGTDDGKFPDDFGYEAIAKRHGQPEYRIKFTVGDAKRAGLWGKNTWAQYPKDMLRHKAVARAANAEFPDVLGGLSVVEDIRDTIEVDAQVIERPSTTQDLAAKLEAENEAPETQADPLAELRAEWGAIKKQYKLDNALLSNGLKHFGATLNDCTPDQLSQVINAIRSDCESLATKQQELV